jgi:hypothetical protein
MARRSWRNFLEPAAPKKPEKHGPYSVLPAHPGRTERAADIYANHARLEEAAAQLRLSSDLYCLQAATLVEAALEVLQEGLVNLCGKKPKNKPNDPTD